MSLADRIDEITTRTPQPCKYARTISLLRESDDRADEFHDLVMDGRIDGSKASAALDKEGHFVADTVIRKHVRGVCCCFR